MAPVAAGLDILQELLDDRGALTRRLLGQPPGVGSERGGLEAPPSMFRALAASGLPLPPDVRPAR